MFNKLQTAVPSGGFQIIYAILIKNTEMSFAMVDNEMNKIILPHIDSITL